MDDLRILVPRLAASRLKMQCAARVSHRGERGASRAKMTELSFAQTIRRLRLL